MSNALPENNRQSSTTAVTTDDVQERKSSPSAMPCDERVQHARNVIVDIESWGKANIVSRDEGEWGHA